MENERKLNPSVYNEMVSSVNINFINLMQLNVKNANYDISDSELSVNMTFTNEGYSIDMDVLQVHPQFLIEVIDNKKDVALSINFEYFIEYGFNGLEDIQNEYIEAFVTRNVPVNIWPYARELVSSLTTRMGFPALVIETYKG